MLLQNLVTWDNSNYSFIILAVSGQSSGGLLGVLCSCSCVWPQAAAIWKCTWILQGGSLTGPHKSVALLGPGLLPQDLSSLRLVILSAVWWLAFPRGSGH